MKRFYKEVSVASADDGFRVLLDGRPVMTPAKKTLAVPSQILADAIAAEWAAQEETIDPVSMPLLRLADTVIDGIEDNRESVIAAVLRFADNDLLCYRAHQPPDLAQRQREGWDPLLDWAARQYNARLTIADGLNHIDQPPETLAALRAAIANYDAYTLAGLHVLASITGSLVLALAVVEGETSSVHAFQVSRIDENYQIEKWGADSEAEARASNLARELDKAVELIEAVRR
jgi:chaperone required for assembly of F1-ATPase